ncbi:MAG: NADH-quinone oxidoreductase subunit J [Thermodesulfobacteriota bacterium]|nr:NADH-quinone oxidoreductase subunit J [Thermodesulfobacteriota bacterium]
MTAFFFFSIATVTVISALLVILLRNPIHCALSLVLTFFSLAGLYVLLNAQFIAAIQVIVYAGAIMVLFLFVIMLLNLDKVEKVRERHPLQKAFGILVASLLLVALGSVAATGFLYGSKGVHTAAEVGAIGNTKAIAGLLFTDWVLPFEITSILLLAAIVGAIVLSKREL